MAYSLWWSKVQYTLNRGGPWSTNLHSGASSFKERIIRTRQSIIHFSFLHVPNSDCGSALHRCMHCSLRKDLRCMHSLFVRRRPGHASLFDRGLVSPVRCRKPVLNYRVRAIELSRVSHIVYERLLCLRENSLVWMRSQYLLQKACDRPRWMCIDLCSLDVLDAACSALIRCAGCSMQSLLFFDADKHNLHVQ